MISKVLLIKLAYKKSYYKYGDLPAGLGYISQALLNANIDNAVYDMYLNKDISNLFGTIADYKPGLIGLSLMSFRFLEHYKFINSLKTRYPDIPIVVGGPHLSTLRESVLSKCKSVDFGITLEGDETIVDLCKNIENPEVIKGLIYRDEESIIYTGDRPLINDLDKLGFPKYECFDLEKYGFVTIITSRGCPFRCTYCPVLYTIGNKWRYRTAESVGEELEYWYKKGITRFEFGDDNFTLKRDRVFEICDQIKDRGLKGIKIGLGNGIRADKVDKEMLMKMKEVGFSYIAFGVEAGNNKVLKNLNKGETIEKIENGIKWACELDFPVHLFFLLGSPGETEEDVKDSVNLALKYPVTDVRFYNLIPFPQSKLYTWVEDNNLFLRDIESHLNDASHWVFSPLFETPELSKADRIRLLKWANSVTKRHTTRVIKKRKIEQLKMRGIPYFLATIMVHVGMIEFIRGIFLKTGLWHRAKKMLVRKHENSNLY